MSTMRFLGISFIAVFSFLVTSSICNAGPIHEAVKANNLDEVVRLLDSGTDVNERVKNDQFCNFTPLLMAVWEDKLEIATELIKRGADVKALDQAGRNPLLAAAYNGNSKMIQMLLDNGAKPMINTGELFMGELVDPVTPLCVAMSNYKIDAARILVMNGADVNIADSEGDTPLHSAASGGFMEMAQLLIDHGANVNAETPGYHWTPLQAAGFMGHKDMMDLLISHGADVNVRNWSGKTAMDMFEQYEKNQKYKRENKK